MPEIDSIILKVEEVNLKCTKSELIQNSDYFKVMFEGNFAERDKSCVELQGIDLHSMKLILTLIWDTEFHVHDDELLGVLQVACMLQFQQIRDKCVQRLNEILCPKNCIEIWYETELLGLKAIWPKAKNLALMEFDVITEESFTNLSLTQLHSYLGNILLNVTSEMDVFVTCMIWYWLNESNLIELLNCIDFNNLLDCDISEMMCYPDVCRDTFVVNTLSCLLCLRNKKIDCEKEFHKEVYKAALKLLNCRRRNPDYADVMFFVRNKLNLDDAGIFKDKRLRKFNHGEASSTTNSIVLYDQKCSEFVKFLDGVANKFDGLKGYNITGYKELIFVFGGEVIMGSGNWNLNFWVYDTMRERWERKTQMPVGRRHFDTCLCGNYLYIIGGTGNFRIIQDNMFSYNYKNNVWSKQILLPCQWQQINQCNYGNKLFLINLSKRCGYLFDNISSTFVPYEFDEDGFSITYPERFAFFAYGNHLYIKGHSSITEFELVDMTMKVVSHRLLERLREMYLQDYIVCGDILYSVFKDEDMDAISMESYSIRTSEAKMILNDQDPRLTDLGSGLKLFALKHHYRMQDDDVYVNGLID